MLKSYLTTAWRNIRKNKVFSFINVIGLSIGMAACLLILQDRKRISSGLITRALSKRSSVSDLGIDYDDEV